MDSVPLKIRHKKLMWKLGTSTCASENLSSLGQKEAIKTNVAFLLSPLIIEVFICIDVPGMENWYQVMNTVCI